MFIINCPVRLAGFCMSKTEQESRNSSEDPERPSYLKASRFAGERSAWNAYSRLQTLVFDTDCDLSGFRFQLNGAWLVAMLGESPPDGVGRRINGLLSKGNAAGLPEEIVEFLQERRKQAMQPGSLWVERHLRSGEEKGP